MANPMQIPGLIPSVGPAGGARPIAPVDAPATRDFKSVLIQSLEEVNRLQSDADAGVQRLLTGETDNVAEVLAAVNKAGIAFDLLMEIRNKLTEAYQEIKQMQV